METPLSAKAALLQALAIPGYGLELVERIRHQSARLVQLRPGSIYPALRALERRHLVTSRADASHRAVGRPARYYELTLKGVALATAQREALGVFFRQGRHDPPSVGQVRLMRERLRRCAQVSGFVLKLRGATARAAGTAP
jgi:DNA-binding PadR family transcriptional regulator